MSCSIGWSVDVKYILKEMNVRSWLLGDKEATDGMLTEKREKSLLLFSIHKSPMGTLNIQDENKSACP